VLEHASNSRTQIDRQFLNFIRLLQMSYKIQRFRIDSTANLKSLRSATVVDPDVNDAVGSGETRAAGALAVGIRVPLRAIDS